MAERLDETELKALLSDEIRSAILYDRSELSDKRTRALEYYRGEMNDTKPAPNRSSVTDRTVADTIGWVVPGIIRVFTASDRMAEYEPVGRGDEAFAKQATDYCNHIFWKDNEGYRVLWNATHDSLLQGNGIVKHWWDDAEDCSYSEHSGLTAEQIAMLLSEGNTEIVAQAEGEPQMVVLPGPDGQPMQQEVQTWEIKLKRIERNGSVRLQCIEPENFMMDRDAVCIEDARFCAHREEKTRSELVEMGFDRDLVEALPSDRHSGLQEEQHARDEEYDGLGDVGHDSMRLVELYECYVRIDVDGDGIAEMVRAYYAGASGAGELLDWEVWDDDVPFSDIPCEPVPHRWDARSIADETIDVQRIKTVLTRQMLDNLYASNVPMREVEEGSIVNPEMLFNPVFGGTIIRKKGTQPLVPHAVPFVADKVLGALEHFDAVVEKRTGVSRATMALDPQALTNQTATASQNQRDAAYSQIELIARNQAELGWRRVFRQILKLVVKHQDRPRTIRLRDEWIDMDPRHWNASMDVTINVGLGTGSRDRDMQMLNTVFQMQSAIALQMAQGGMVEQALEMLPKIVGTAVKIAESAGLKNAEDYYPQFNEQVMQGIKQQMAQKAQQPDPKIEAEMAKMQGQMQLEQAKLQTQVSKEAAQLESDTQMRQFDAQLKQMEINGKLVIEREKMALQRELKLLELGMKANEETGEVVSKKDEQDAVFAAAMEKLLQAVNALTVGQNTPKRVVRDPTTGRAIGIEPVVN